MLTFFKRNTCSLEDVCHFVKKITFHIGSGPDLQIPSLVVDSAPRELIHHALIDSCFFFPEINQSCKYYT